MRYYVEVKIKDRHGFVPDYTHSKKFESKDSAIRYLLSASRVSTVVNLYDGADILYKARRNGTVFLENKGTYFLALDREEMEELL
jgi:hypothetical protein